MKECDIYYRFFDFIFSSAALLVLSPLLIPVVCILRCTGEREVFYSQERIGLHGNKIAVLKFATMLKDSPKMGTGTVTLKDDPRVLPFGKLLRLTKINELPQLINIFNGDMSLIGPRPLTEETINFYDPSARAKILSVAPGLSGVGSIIFRAEEKWLHKSSDPIAFYKDVIAPYKSEVELWYIENRSVGLYFKLIIYTVLAVFRPGNFDLRALLKTIPDPPSQLR